jgi:cyclopropane-fatty-acyl-phospholipid synthase
MATEAEINETYNYMDEIFRLTFGDHADCSAAMYDLDFSKTLQDAQVAKHKYILTNLCLTSGSRVLDIGCGWGPILNVLRSNGMYGVGITLSSKQADWCLRSGFEVYLKDWKAVDAGTFGTFNGIVSIGAFEHFCSKKEFLDGAQETIYRRFFTLCSDLISKGERLYLQTMLWGKNAPPPHEISLHAMKGSNAYMVAVLERLWPGSWLPLSEEQIIDCAKPGFRLVSMKNGRQDYIETMNQWNKIWRPTTEKIIPAIKAARYLLLDRTFLYKIRALANSYNRECFRREVMDHQRIVFEKS